MSADDAEVGSDDRIIVGPGASLVGRGIEQADVDRAAVGEADSGEIETLPDGSVSIPVFEEQLVIERRLVVRERIIVRKTVVTEEVPVTADLRRERVEVDGDAEVAEAVHPPPGRRDG